VDHEQRLRHDRAEGAPHRRLAPGPVAILADIAPLRPLLSDILPPSPERGIVLPLLWGGTIVDLSAVSETTNPSSVESSPPNAVTTATLFGFIPLVKKVWVANRISPLIS
jgi:hypothetical protein